MIPNKLSELPTYVLVDVSNIRSACLRSCNFNIDFEKLYAYLKNKYTDLKDVRYYEGLAQGDLAKQEILENLEKIGYNIKVMRRRTYVDPAVMKSFECKECRALNRVEVSPRATKMKSNVDVFLASEMLKIAYNATGPIHIVLLACDGDYAEAIKIAMENENVKITVIATPSCSDRSKNALSIRLKELKRDLRDRYNINSIKSIEDKIKI